MPIHCHQNCNQMCLNMGYVVDGVVVRQKTDDSHADSFDCPQQRGCLRGRSLRQQVYNADRIKYPMKRKSWQPGGGEAAHGELRGKDEWERISWDEALTYVTDELKRVYAQYGQDAVICNGWRWAPGSAMFPVIGGAVYNTECESFGCWAFQTEALGMYSHGDHPDLMMAPDKYDLPNADTIVLYGCNPAWSQHSSMYWLKNAQKAGVNFVFVGPDYNATAAAMDARWIRVRPGTDTAFLLAVAYEMVRLDEERGDIIDWDFVNERTVGFTPETMPADATTDENFRDYLLGAYDNTPKTPEWATEICGTPVEDITWYAEMAGKNNAVMFLHSYAASRYLGAENLSQAFMTVSALGGHFGKSGHGSAAIYTWDAGDWGYRLIQHVGGDYGYVDNLVGSPAATGPNRNIEGNSWWSSLADGKYLSSSEGPYDLGSSDVVGDPTKLRANTPVYHEAREMPVNPRLLVQTNSNFMQTRGNLVHGHQGDARRRHLRVLRDQVLAHGSVRRHHPAGVHPLGGQRRRELGRAVLAEPLRRRQRPEAAQGRPARLEAPGEADVRGPRGEARLPRDHRAHGVQPGRRLPEEQLRPVASATSSACAC